MITLIHGPAELLRAEALDQIRPGIASDPALAGLNTVALDAKSTRLADLQFACDALPFLADRRLVIADGLLRRASAARSKGKAGAAAATAAPTGEAGPDDDGGGETAALADLLAYLPNVPETTELVFLEDDLITSNTILKRINELARVGKAKIVVCTRPKKADLPGWIRERAKRHKLALDPAAVAALAEFVGDDLRQLDQELAKLADYAASRAAAGGGRHTVTRDDVRLLVPETRAANVFDLVEALGSGRAADAARLMQHALDADGEQPLRLMALISRQYRLIIQAKELRAAGATQADVARQLGVPDWTVPKLASQADHYTFERLVSALECLLAADEAIKTGKLTDREAMDVLLAQLVGLMNS